MRAVAQDAEVASMQGVEVERSLAFTFFISCSLTGLAGILVAPLYYVDVFLGTPAIMRTIIVVVLGGLGSFPGAIVGGLILGFVHSFGYSLLGSVTHLISFAIVIMILIIRPRGLLGNE